MAKVNLTVASDRLFGKYLPAVFINRILIDYDRSDESTSDKSKTKFNVELTINFTKDTAGDGEENLEEVKSWLTKNMDGLYLYGFLCPNRRVNNAVKRKRLNLKDLFQTFAPPTPETFTTEHVLYPILLERMIEQWKNKEINYFGYEGGGTEGGFDSLPDGMEFAGLGESAPSEPGVALAQLYYLGSPEQIGSSTSVMGSVFNILFYGNNPSGPWVGSFGDLPEKISYGDPPDPYFGAMVPIGGSDGSYSTDLVPDRQSFIKKNLPMFLSELSESDYAKTGSLLTKVKLIDLLEPGALNPGKLVFREVFDENGNEILQITDIKLGFVVDESSGTFLLEDVAELMFMATVGLDINESSLLTGAKGIGISGAPRLIFNNYFGPVTYETLLKRNRVDESFTEIFVDSDGIPYDDTPIQALNGRFYVEDKVTKRTIADSLLKIGRQNLQKYPSDKNLIENFTNLEYLIAVFGDDVNFFKEFKRFQRTYPIKSQRLPTGKMYHELVNAVTQASKRVTLQKQLFKKLILNTLVVDLRATQFVSEEYSTPNPSNGLTRGKMETTIIEAFPPDLGPFPTGDDGEPIFEGLSSESPSGTSGDTIPIETGMFSSLDAAEISDDYIPRSWIQLSRTTKSASPSLSGFSSLAGIGETKSDKDELLRSVLFASGLDPDATEGFGMIAAAAIEEGIDDAYFDDPDRSLIESLYGERQLDSNLVCRNMGYWFFDWEKALHTQSQMAHVVKLSALQRFLGIAVPYKYFRIVNARMIRKELAISRKFESTSDFVVPPGEGPGTKDIHYAVQNMELDDGASFPKTKASYYGGFSKGSSIISPAMLEIGELSDGAIDADTVIAGDAPGPDSFRSFDWLDELGVGYPFVDLLIDSEAAEDRTVTVVPSKSEFKIVDFDVVGSSSDFRLEGYGKFTPYGEDMALQQGRKIRDGYRLVAFAFKDYMDDDLAYYNTNYGEDFNRSMALMGINDRGDPTSQYTVQVIIEDSTMSFLVNKVYGLISNSYEDLKEYVLFAEEVCSYNNITNQFNQFFIDAINERYPTKFDRPWIKAAFIINSMREIFFNDFADDDLGQEEAILATSIDMINKISPERGNLDNLRAFLRDYRRFILFFDPFNSDIEVPVTSIPTPFFYDRILEVAGLEELREEGRLPTVEDFQYVKNTIDFVNSFSIKAPIYGDINLNTYKAGEAASLANVYTNYPGFYVPSDVDKGKPAGYAAVQLAAESGTSRFNYHAIRNFFIKNGSAGSYLMSESVYQNVDRSYGVLPEVAGRLKYIQALMLRIASHSYSGGMAPAAVESTEYYGDFDIGPSYSGILTGDPDRNRTGVNAQTLLYIIINKIKPKLDQTDEVFHKINRYYDNEASTAAGFSMFDTDSLDEIEADSAADSSGYSAYDAVTGGASRGSGLDNERVPTRQERQYEEFRYAIAEITNGLINVIKGNLGFPVLATSGQSWEADRSSLPSTLKPTTLAVFRNLLDRDDPIGPDYNNLFNGGKLDRDRLDSFRDSATYGSLSFYTYYPPGSDSIISSVFDPGATTFGGDFMEGGSSDGYASAGGYTGGA